MDWEEEAVCEETADHLSRALSISPILARFLVSRGLSQAEDAKTFLSPKLADLADPFDLPEMREAVDRLVRALKEKEKILIVGDYDVDGITSTVILRRTLTLLGNEPAHVTPRRKDEGYGLTQAVLERGLTLTSPGLVIALDCGTNSKEERGLLAEREIDLLVVDHHQAKTELPEDTILLNPHLHEDCGEPWRHLCTAGLTFKLAHGLLKRLREEENAAAQAIRPKDFLSLAALGTLADLVSLRGENRILARYGLKHLAHEPGPGLQALLQVAGVKPDIPLAGEDVTFRVAPRINACGRLDQADVATELLLANDPDRCRTLAEAMDGFNVKRRGIEAELTQEAEVLAKERFGDKLAVVASGSGEHWNPGVVGIVAGKLASELDKPCIVLARENGECKGSGRSAGGVNMVEALSRCKDLLNHWGGHPAAVGLSLPAENLEAFEQAFAQVVADLTGGQIPSPSLSIEATLAIEDLRSELLLELADLAPFGQDNPEPLLALRNVRLARPPRPVGAGQEHFQFAVHNGEELIYGIAWNMGDDVPPTSYELDLAFRFRWNHWNGRKLPQMVLRDWRRSS